MTSYQTHSWTPPPPAFRPPLLTMKVTLRVTGNVRRTTIHHVVCVCDAEVQCCRRRLGVTRLLCLQRLEDDAAAVFLRLFTRHKASHEQPRPQLFFNGDDNIAYCLHAIGKTLIEVETGKSLRQCRGLWGLTKMCRPVCGAYATPLQYNVLLSWKGGQLIKLHGWSRSGGVIAVKTGAPPREFDRK